MENEAQIKQYIEDKNKDSVPGTLDTIKSEFNSLIGREQKETKNSLNLFGWLKNDENLLAYAELTMKTEKLKLGESIKYKLLELKLSVTCPYFKDFKQFLEELKKGEYVSQSGETGSTGAENVEFQGKSFCGLSLSRIFSSPYYKNSQTGVTRCSKTARENGKKFGIVLPSGDAYDAGINPGQDCKGTLPPEKKNDRPKKNWEAISPSKFTSGLEGNYADIYVESGSDYGHRASAFKDDSGQRYVLDPYTRVNGRLDTTPKKLEDYVKVKKIVKAHFYESKCYIPDNQEVAENPQVEKAVQRAISIAEDNCHGYERGGKGKTGNYDCSGLVTNAFKEAGFNIPVSGTNTMKENFTKAGFEWISPYNPSNLKRGDILLKDVGADGERHTEIYTGNGKFVGARSNYDKISGDSSGNEIAESSDSWLMNFAWDGILRYKG